MNKKRKPKPDAPEPVRWLCQMCRRPVKQAGSPPDRCEFCGYDGFISPELVEKHQPPRDGEQQA